MTIVIETVPESITIERVQELVRAFGLDTRDLRSFSIDTFAVTAEVYARNASGERYFASIGSKPDVAIHSICIPIIGPAAT